MTPREVEGGERPAEGSYRSPSSLANLAPLLIVAGLVLAVVGWMDVGLFYIPTHFGSAEWEFGIIAQTFDALPLPSLGLVLLALGIQARGGAILWTKGMAVLLVVTGALCVVALLVFAHDIPLALKAMQRSGSQANNVQAAVFAAGMKRGMVKVIVFGVCYAAAYGTMALIVWRMPRDSRFPSW